MIRTWKVHTLSGAAEPWFGDKITAAFAPVVGRDFQIVTVADTTIYRVGDRIILGFGQAGANIVMVDKLVSATVLQVRSEGNAALSAWTNNTIISLAIACFGISFQPVDGNTGAVWLGTDNTVTVAGGSAFRQLQKVASGSIPDWWMYQPSCSSANALNTDNGWMIGTLNDKIVIAAHIN